MYKLSYAEVKTENELPLNFILVRAENHTMAVIYVQRKEEEISPLSAFSLKLRTTTPKKSLEIYAPERKMRNSLLFFLSLPRQLQR